MTTPTFEPSSQTIRIGLIGTGSRAVSSVGKLFTVQEGVRLAALADSNAARMKNAQEMLGIEAELHTDYKTMLHETPLDGVVITTPDFMHAEQVITALRAGVKHVLVDKPPATTVQGCLDIILAMQKTGGRVTVGFNLRHRPMVVRIKELLENGEIGELMMADNREFYDEGRTYMARWNRHYEWSGGLWIHKGSHDFDVFNWWNEAGNPQRVFASAGINALRPDRIPFAVQPDQPVGPTCTQCSYDSLCPDYNNQAKSALFSPTAVGVDGYHKDLCLYTSDKSVHDNGIAIVQYDNNVRISHMECFACGITDRYFTLVGTGGVLMSHLKNPTQIELHPRWGQARIIDVPQPREGHHGGADPAMVEEFIAAMRGELAPLHGMRDGLRSVAVGQAAELSWRQGRAVEIAELVDWSDPALEYLEQEPVMMQEI